MLFSGRINYWRGEQKFGGGILLEGTFAGRGGMNTFFINEGGTSPSPSSKNTVVLSPKSGEDYSGVGESLRSPKADKIVTQYSWGGEGGRIGIDREEWWLEHSLS